MITWFDGEVAVRAYAVSKPTPLLAPGGVRLMV